MAVHPQKTVTAELRKWRRNGEYIEGYIYQDINDIWEDGDHAILGPVLSWPESANFYLAVTLTACYKLSKDEEVK